MPYSRRYQRRNPGRYRAYQRRSRAMTSYVPRTRMSYPRGRMTYGRVKRIIDAELKKFDISAEELDVPTVTGQMVHLTPIGQGDTNVLRNGNQLTPVKLNGYIFVSGNTAQTNFSSMRVGIMRWNEDFSATPPTIAIIAADSSDPLAPYNLDNKGQFSVLWSRLVVLSNNSANPKILQQLRFSLKLAGAPKTLFDGAGFKKYHYFLFAWSDIAAAADEPLLTLSTSFRFTDS